MKNKLYFALATVLTLNNVLSAQAADSEWERFGDWEVRPVHGDMDPYTKVIIRTKFNEYIDPKKSPLFHRAEDLVFGFSIFNGRSMNIYTMVNFGGDNYWPTCDFNLASFRVGNSKPHYISTIDSPGDCDSVAMNGKTVAMFKSSKTAELKVHYRTGDISLAGFSSAYARALQLSHR